MFSCVQSYHTRNGHAILRVGPFVPWYQANEGTGQV